jgi:hypothetical protein
MPSLLTNEQPLSQEETRLLNEATYEKFASDDPMLFKEAVDAVNDFTRFKMREDGIFRKILPPVPISNDQLDRDVEDEKPRKVVDREPDSPAAISVPLATLPQGIYIRGNRYQVLFERILSPRFSKDVDELRTWMMDIRQVLSDNAVKDMLAEEDGKAFFSVDYALVGPNVTLLTSGVPQYVTYPGGITRESLWESMKVLPSTSSSFEAKTIVLNNLTIKDLCKIGFDEMGGGDMSVNIMRDGWTYENFMGKRWLVTIKKKIVPNGHMYHFCDESVLGKHYMLEDTTMWVKREAFMIDFFAYQYSGAAWGHANGLGHVHFLAAK